jgi:YVTN family beta-propeller protein
LDSRHRPESHSHDLRLARSQADRYDQRQLWHRDNHRENAATTARTAPGAQSGPPQGPPPGPPGGDWDETVVRVGNGSEGFDISPDHKEIWVGNSQEGTISVIDFASKKVVDTIAANARGANRLKFTPDGARVFVSTLSGGELIILDAHTHKELKRLKLGKGSAGILVQPDGARAFVACSPDNNIAVIDLKTLEVVSRLEVGQEPDGMAWSVSQ